MLFFWRKLKKHDPTREKVLRAFEKMIGYRFKSLDLLNSALTHPSYLNEKQIKDQVHYERLEFLGDAVLGLIVCGHIFKEFPHYNEGSLSDIKSHVVSEKHLSAISKRMGVGKYILLGAGEARSGGRRKISILANVFESIVGAIFLDGGFESARRYMLRVSRDDIVMHPPNRELFNYKGILQKQCQQYLSSDPNYRVIAENGPSHKRTFEMEVWVNNRRLGSAMGRSKKEAEQKAALVGINYFKTPEFQKIFKKLESEKNQTKKRSRSQKRNARRA
ncbi:MAG: ribonuclease III [Nitrospinota bacterium]